MVKRLRWFPWLEVACGVVCIPLFVAFMHMMDMKHAVPSSYSNRSPAPIALGFSFVFSSYGVVRFMFVHPALLITFPFLVFAGYILFGAVFIFFGSIF
jgi:hypothetical protein